MIKVSPYVLHSVYFLGALFTIAPKIEIPKDIVNAAMQRHYNMTYWTFLCTKVLKLSPFSPLTQGRLKASRGVADS